MFKLLMLVIVLISVRQLNAQDIRINTASDTLVVLWSSGDPEVAEKACLMYSGAAKKMAGLRKLF